MRKPTLPLEELMETGHLACQGCGATLAMRYVLKALGSNTVINIPACCWAVIPGVFPYKNLNVPVLFNAFECSAATASGIRRGFKKKGLDNINVVAFAGDGGTADIGIQALSGAADRNEDIFYVCYDNEAYMNTGIQRSGATPKGAWTTTTPGGKKNYYEFSPKKNVPMIMIAHKIPYVATCTVAFPEDLIAKFNRAKKIRGLKYIHILSPCPPGWRAISEKTIELSRLAVYSQIFPLYEYFDGKFHLQKIGKKVPVQDYFIHQGRFAHLTSEMIEQIQSEIDANWEWLNSLNAK